MEQVNATEHIHVRLTPAQKQALDRHLRERNISVSEFFRRHIEQLTGVGASFRRYKNMRPDAYQRTGKPTPTRKRPPRRTAP